MKPKPPADLWAQLDKALAEIAAYVPQKPPNAFTINEFAAKFSLTVDQAACRVAKLKRFGKVRRVGGPSRNGYYEFIEQ